MRDGVKTRWKTDQNPLVDKEWPGKTIPLEVVRSRMRILAFPDRIRLKASTKISLDPD